MIRTLWFYLVVVVSSVIHATGVIVAALLGVKRRPGGGDVYDWGTNDWSRQVLWAAGTPVRAEGLDRIPDRPVLYAANHSSMFDIWALAATRSEEHTSELQSPCNLVCRLLLEKKKEAVPLSRFPGRRA